MFAVLQSAFTKRKGKKKLVNNGKQDKHRSELPTSPKLTLNKYEPLNMSRFFVVVDFVPVSLFVPPIFYCSPGYASETPPVIPDPSPCNTKLGSRKQDVRSQSHGTYGGQKQKPHAGVEGAADRALLFGSLSNGRCRVDTTQESYLEQRFM